VTKLRKIVFIGDASVGKTSIIHKYLKNDLPDRPTIGLDIHHVVVQDNKMVIWDLSGQSKFKEVLHPYLRGADLYVLVFDLTRKKSLENLLMWSKMLAEVASNNAKVVLVGNKKDLGKAIDDKEIREKLNELPIKVIDYIETSALTGENIEELFNKIAMYVK